MCTDWARLPVRGLQTKPSARARQDEEMLLTCRPSREGRLGVFSSRFICGHRFSENGGRCRKLFGEMGTFVASWRLRIKELVVGLKRRCDKSLGLDCYLSNGVDMKVRVLLVGVHSETERAAPTDLIPAVLLSSLRRRFKLVIAVSSALAEKELPFL